MPDPLTCPKCGSDKVMTRRMVSGPHYAEARCGRCSRFLKWLSKSQYEQLCAAVEAELTESTELTKAPSESEKTEYWKGACEEARRGQHVWFRQAMIYLAAFVLACLVLALWPPKPAPCPPCMCFPEEAMTTEF